MSGSEIDDIDSGSDHDDDDGDLTDSLESQSS